MAPLSHLLFLHLFLLSPLFLASCLSVSDSATQLPQIPNTQIYLGRRTLLGKTLLDEDEDEDEETPPLPKKKKVPKPALDEDDDDDDHESLALPKKKKTSSSNSNKQEEVLPKKKKVPKPDLDEGDDAHESLAFPKKKKTSSSNSKEEGHDEQVSPKKKKTLSSNKQEDEQVSPKKKKTSSSNKQDEEEDEQVSPKKKKTLSSNKQDEDDENASLKKKKLEKQKDAKLTTTSSKYQTKLIKPKPTGGLGLGLGLGSSSSKNKTKLIKPTPSKKDVILDHNSPTLSTKTKLKKLNSTSTSTKPKTASIAKNNENKPTKTKSEPNNKPPATPASWTYEADSDFVSEIRDLPTKFQQSFIPDLHRISTTSQNYIYQANKEMTKGFKPYVGNKYAPSVTIAISVGFIIIPLILVFLIFNKIKAYFSIQRLIIFVQIYLAIYFSILCFSSMLTGLEPLRFFYATSQSTYVWVQVLQTLGYVLYLLMLLMYLVLVFSTETSLGQKGLGLAQTFVGFAVGLHYYVTVFHRVVLRQPPRTNWKVHGVYATCFVVICLFARAERIKKAYIVEGGEEGKKS